MRVNLLLTLIFIILCSIYCRETNTGKSRDELTGTWQLKSDSDNTIVKNIPERSGDKIVIMFTPDSRYLMYCNDSLIIDSRFSIRKKGPLLNRNKDYIITCKNSGITQTCSFVGKNKLVIDGIYSKSSENIYERVN